MSFTQTTEELAATREKVAKLNKRAAKAGIAATATVNVIETRTVKSVNDQGLDRTYVIHEVEIEGTEAVRLGDWTLAAVLDHDAAGNIFRTVPGFEVEIPAEFRGTDAERCDHCGLRRNRNNTILVWNGTEGFKQVGSDCVKLFLGVSVTSLIAWLDDLDKAQTEGGRVGTDYTVSEYVAAAALVTAVYGFAPASFDNATRSIVGEFLAPKSEAARYRFNKEFPELVHPTETDIARANELAAGALTWIANETGSDYITNLSLAAAREFVGRNGGLLASLPNAYKRHLGDVAERAAKVVLPDSAHVGNVGDKVTTVATVAYTNRSEGFAFNSPDSLFIILQGQDGNVFYVNTTVATAVGSLLEDARKDDVFTVTGTVKAHKLNNKGQAVTVLTRCKAQEV